LRPDLIHRPGVGTSLGKAGVTTHPKQCNRSSSTVRLTRLDWWNGGLLGSVASRRQSPEAALRRALARGLTAPARTEASW